jgi:oxygen-independent coproporphyrinogen-3 oxidase
MTAGAFQSLYVHVPFCRGKCSYCAFYSLGESSADERRAYLERLEQEMRQGAQNCAQLQSVFFGGGTPSAMTADELEQLAGLVKNCFSLAPDCEWSVEANPESMDEEKIALLAEHGVNRLSFGVQSFSPSLRRTIGRRGSPESVGEWLSVARQHGIQRCNLDFIYAIPGQTLADWEADLRQAVALAPTHVSTYALTIEEGTRLAGQVNPASDDVFLEMWDAADAILGAVGFQRYEISNFALAGEECRHNVEVWQGGTYLGCGPSAVSFDGAGRSANPSDLTVWLNRAPPVRETLPEHEQAAEVLAFGMRRAAGWQWQDFQQRTGYDALQLRGDALAQLTKRGLLTSDALGARPTRQGMLFNDDVIMELL